MSKSSEVKKDLKLLIKIIKKIYKAYGIDGTFKKKGSTWIHREAHNFISWNYKNFGFSTTLGSTPKSSNAAFSSVRTELRRIGLDKGNNKYWHELTVRLATNSSAYDRMAGYLSALERQIEDDHYLPYKKIITYLRNGKEITYTRYYVWRTIRRGIDYQSTGFITSRKDEYDRASKDHGTR